MTGVTRAAAPHSAPGFHMGRNPIGQSQGPRQQAGRQTPDGRSPFRRSEAAKAAKRQATSERGASRPPEVVARLRRPQARRIVRTMYGRAG